MTSWDSQVALFVRPFSSSFLPTFLTRFSLLQEHAVKTFGPIDVVIANAGIFEGGVLLEDKLDEEGKLAVRFCILPT